MNKSLLPVVLVPTCLLLIPLAAMISKADGWAWNATDFIVWWVLIAGTVLAYKFVASKAGSVTYRVAAGVGLGAGFILVWINGAVGLIGSEGNPANLMYGGGARRRRDRRRDRAAGTLGDGPGIVRDRVRTIPGSRGCADRLAG